MNIAQFLEGLRQRFGMDYDNNLPNGGMPPPRGRAPMRPYPAEEPPETLPYRPTPEPVDVTELLRGFVGPYENNLPNGGEPRAPRIPQGPAVPPQFHPSGESLAAQLPDDAGERFPFTPSGERFPAFAEGDGASQPFVPSGERSFAEPRGFSLSGAFGGARAAGQPHAAHPFVRGEEEGAPPVNTARGPMTGTPPSAAAPASAGGSTPSMPPAMPQSGVTEGAFPEDAEEPMPPRRSLGDRYAELTGKIPKAGTGELTPQQKAQLQLDFFLNLMAKGTKPGAKFLGAFGESGLDVSGKLTSERDKNMRREKEGRRESMDEAFRQIGFEDKDEDNVRADRTTRVAEKRQSAADRRDQERLKIAREQLAQGSFAVEKSANGLVLVNKKDGSAKLIRDEKGKVLQPSTSNPNIDFYKWLMDDPKRTELYLGSKGKTVTDEDILKNAIDLVKGSMGSMTLDQAMDQVRRSVGTARGQGGPAGPQKPATQAEAHSQAKAAKARGVPVDQINQRLKAWGYAEIK